jgi:hypothetical protein
MQYVTLGDTVYLWFAGNDTSGSGADGSAPAFDVREGGAGSTAAPTLSGTPSLLTHANFPDGAYEVAVAATTGNGFAAGKTYGVFCNLTVSAQNPTGFVGTFRTAPAPANVLQSQGVAVELADFYHAEIAFTRDQANSQDEYSVTWFKNGTRQTGGITSPTIQVVKRSDGTNLVASTAMTQIGSTGSYKYDEASGRVTPGEAVLVVVTAAIDAATRSFSRLISRDS